MKISPLQIKQRVSLYPNVDAVLVDNIDSSAPTRNIFLIDAESNVIWQAEAAIHSNGSTGYSSVYLNPQNELLAYSSNGVEYHLDSASGSILNKELIR